jgi:hypothetical protein
MYDIPMKEKINEKDGFSHYWNNSNLPTNEQGSLSHLLNHFIPVTLEDMDAVTLQDRIDTKYLLSMAQLLNTISLLTGSYQVLEVQSRRINQYRTLYFDSGDFYLYNMHVNGLADRYKVRSREYADSHLSYLEVKHKTQKDRTIKERIVTDKPLHKLNPAAEQWLASTLPLNTRQLEPKIWNSFSRITLVGNTSCERVTIDLNINFSYGDKSVSLSNIVVAEVKQAGHNCFSDFVNQMQLQRIHEQPFSKYCIGTSMLFEQVKKNSLKPQLIMINKMIAGA